jgi:hypothetical protein
MRFQIGRWEVALLGTSVLFFLNSDITVNGHLLIPLPPLPVPLGYLAFWLALYGATASVRSSIRRHLPPSQRGWIRFTVAYAVGAMAFTVAALAYQIAVGYAPLLRTADWQTPIVILNVVILIAAMTAGMVTVYRNWTHIGNLLGRSVER